MAEQGFEPWALMDRHSGALLQILWPVLRCLEYFRWKLSQTWEDRRAQGLDSLPVELQS